MRLSIASVFSALVALVAATKPDYSQDPSGNPILKPGLNQLVTAGKPFSIEWTPTTQNPVSLVLLRGPGSNVVPIETLAEGIPNSGSFSWTPSTTLEPDTSRYGILLVVQGTGQYQYSTQFGVSNPDYVPSVDSPSGTNSSSTSSATTSTATKSSSVTDSASSALTPSTVTPTPSASASVSVLPSNSTTPTTENPTTTLATKSSTSETHTSTVVVAVPSGNNAVPSAPSGSGSRSGSPSPSVTPSNSADRKAISLGAVVVAAFAVMAF